MESLLSPSESHAIQSFLTSLDTSTQEWTMYSSDTTDDIALDVPQVQGREALTKATKDLMSLDADRWSKPSINGDQRHYQQHNHSQHQHNTHSHSQHFQLQQQQQRHHYDYPQQHEQHISQLRQTGFSQESFPFLHKNESFSHHQSQTQDHHPNLHLPIPTQHPHLHSLAVPPLHGQATPNGANGFPPMSSSSSSTSVTPTSATSPSASAVSVFTFSQTHRNDQKERNGSPPMNPHREPTPSSRQKKQASSLAVHGASQTGTSLSGSTSQKQNLLSPSQKKANHIQSEQKRRANIRRGYEALCETVPALREAIKEEEEREAESRVRALNSKSISGRGGAGSKVKRNTRKKEADGGERIDGRAGPRSENIVLSKTIDYINELISERTALLARLERARYSLPHSHPALAPPLEQPLWEREWKGGEGRLGCINGAGDGDEGEEEEEEESS